ncbi:ATP-dependent helicase [Alicyclobacillus tolerans]|uniref:ATP-dependent helicase n=1 Tax=Alicyclobacillus tolerans TaxID=90970 RepID=UPI001F27C72A|nr:ATP-dependent helicase [Alicyclobacillus tolerans]MCF8567678.1 ATP-dependent helicase [Alicyclobacillus tolerans]
MNPWIQASLGGRNISIGYDELGRGDPHLQQLLHELYDDRVALECTCQDKPVPMHIRRTRICPPSYCLVTNKHYQHAETCARNRQVFNNRTPYELPSTQYGGLPIVPEKDNGASNERFVVGGDNVVEYIGVEVTNDEKVMFLPDLEQLNPAQREVAMHKDGPCIVVAAAGSGKTAMLIAQIQFLVESNVTPERIIACTFTRKAADEMKARLVQAIGARGNEVTIGTIHSIAYRMAMPQIGHGWSLIAEPSRLIEQVLEPAHKQNPNGVGNILSTSEAIFGVYRTKSDGLWPMQVDGALGKVYKAYEKLKMEKRKLDFEDLLLHAVRLFQTRPDFAADWRAKFDHVLVDEFQDVNQVQWMFLCELVKKTRNICVVGDDWQSIYGFRGARPELMSAFLQQFPDAKKVVLSTNYRSHDLIVDLGNRVISLNRGHQIEKQVLASREVSESAVVQVVTVQSDIDEARFIAKEIKELRAHFPDIPYSEYSVLYRTNIQSRVYEEALAEQAIPYHIVGDTHFYENCDVKVILDYLRTAQDKSDPRLWGPLINRPKRLVPQTVVREVQRGGWQVLCNHEKCQAFVKTIAQLEQHALPRDAIRWLIKLVSGIVKGQDDTEPIKWVDSLIQSASRFETVPEFLRYVDWVIERSKEPQKDTVQLMTIHRSKGLEFETVFVAGLAEGLLPHKKSLDAEGIREETRLCYVAITRARENLYLLTSEMYGGKAFEMSRYIKALQSG